MLKKILTSPWTALLTLALVVGLRVADPTFIESVRLRYFDTLVTSRAPETIGVSVVNIDENAIEKYGQFPFSRDIYAAIIKDLYRRNAGLVVFNILTPDRDRMGQDPAYIQTLRQFPTVLPSIGSTQTRNQPRAPGSVVIGPYSLDAFVTYPGIIANIPGVESAAAGVGITNTLPEVDGVVRRMPLVVAYDGKLYPSLAMETLRVAGADSTVQVKINENGVEKMRIPKFGPVSTDSLSRIWIDWSLRPTQYSLTDLPKDFEGEIVIVGVSAQGLSNPVATSLGEMLPQDLQASVLGTVIANKDRPAINRPDWADGAEIIGLLALGILLLFLTRWTYVGLASGLIALVILYPVSQYVYTNYSWLTDITALVGGLVLVLLHAYGVKFVSEFLQKQAIKKQFAGYCSKEVVELLQKDPDLIKRGQRKDVSVMFSDLRGFTPIGEHYGDDVAGLGKYMNGYMDSISRPILDNKGMVIKYVGDASMHIHGAPIEDPNHAHTIVKVGLEMLDKVDEYTKLMEAQGLPPAAMGWGCNSGIGFIGEMGSTERHSYDILGDMVSTAARLEARCKAYGVLCIIGAETYNRTKDDFFYLLLDNLQPKGKTVADLIYTALRTRGADYSKDKEQHEAMHALYKQKKFDEAAAMCKKLKGNFGGQMDKYYKIWIERCEFMKEQNLPDNWNGEFIAHEK
ncbi:CHD domain containing protein [uncultured Caudovirales phage]|uniref:CHD domain containing protein n=1 Tax=uncultured Caudovirales phage TaxID=2100421 RepID=A0A6J5LBY1_9CAUD|nr:CHD domain containing protein [uncultured Caudovirales phage]